jgi:hypothetical protein
MEVRSLATGPGTVYLATVSGIFRSQDVGQHWFPYHSGLPNVEIKELLWTENDLFAATQGRGLWHRGRYETIVVPAAQHAPDIRWLIELWLAIHGGDPAPNAVRQRLGRGFSPAVRR